MLVIGIDPGIATTGYSIIEENNDGGISVRDFGIISTKTSLELPKRLFQLYQELTRITLLHKPHMGAVEKLFFQRNVKTAMNVGHARGISLLVMGEQNIITCEYTPLEIKQAITGYGNADKMQIQRMVGKILNLPNIPYPDDAADALAVAICHLHSYKIKSLTRVDSL